MADHGFGKTKVESSITDDKLDEIAEAISKRPYCIRAWRVHHKFGAHAGNIHWTFRHIGSIPGDWTHEKMVADIEVIVTSFGHTANFIDVYIKRKGFSMEDEQ